MGAAKKTIWLICMACLTIALYSIMLARNDAQFHDVILGGADGTYVGKELVSVIDPNLKVTENDGLEWPDIDITLPQYSLVNNNNLLSSAYSPDLALKDDGKTYDPIYGTKYQAFSAFAKPYLDQMLKDMEKDGFKPYIASSYRTYSFQSQLYNTKTTGIFIEMGFKDSDWNVYPDEYKKASEIAKKYTAPPGASEHQLGLAVDIWDTQRQKLSSYDNMDDDFRSWLEEHSWEYGFIQRYPSKKCLRTGWDEPWHYRYVGKEVAKFIKEQDICYEEFYVHYVPDAKV